MFIGFQQPQLWSQRWICFPEEARSLWSTSPWARRDVTQTRRRSPIPNESNSPKVHLQRAQMDSYTWVRWTNNRFLKMFWKLMFSWRKSEYEPRCQRSRLCVQVMLWSFTLMAAAHPTESKAPEPVSACTGAATTHCKKANTHTRGSRLFSTTNRLIKYTYGGSLAETWLSGCREDKPTSERKYRYISSQQPRSESQSAGII